MDILFLKLAATVALVTLLVNLTGRFHMLQLNSYFNKRYLANVKQTASKWGRVLPVLSLLIFGGLVLISSLFAFVFAAITWFICLIYTVL